MNLRIGPYALMPGMLALLQPAAVEELQSPMEQLMWMHRNVNWWIGDAVNLGLAHHGDDFWQVIDPSFSEALINRCSRVAREYPPKDRFHDLSWSQHQDAMVLPPVLRRAALSLASQNGWNTKELNQYIEEVRHGAMPLQSSSQAGSFAGSQD